MSRKIVTLDDLAEHILLNGMTQQELSERGFTFKEGKDYAGLEEALNADVPPPYTSEAVLATQERRLANFLEVPA